MIGGVHEQDPPGTADGPVPAARPHRGSRADLLDLLAETIGAVRSTYPTRVAIDGPPAAGKTSLADEVSVVLRAEGREVVRATIEGFLFPRARRYRQGIDSPVGCYEDSFDFATLHRVLLDPLGPDGDRRFQVAAYDRDKDTPSSPPVRTAGPDAVLLFDGVFLLRPELNDAWDVRVFVSASFDETLARARTRDLASLGSTARVEERFRVRYQPSQQRYADSIRPVELADVVVHNDDPQHAGWTVRTT